MRNALYTLRNQSWHDEAAQVASGHEPPMKVTWGELGCPTAPCSSLVRGVRIEIRASDIKASKGRPDAIFTAFPHTATTGPTIWLLGAWTVEFPDQKGDK